VRRAYTGTNMSASLIHDIGTEYVAGVLSALTVLAIASLTAAWRRKNRRPPAEEAPPCARDVPTVPAATGSPGTPESQQNSEMSTEGRRGVSS
jgi:hypothetical protein